MISKIPARTPIYLSVLMAITLILGAGGSAQAKFNLSQVGPSYGCNLSTEIGIITQLMQLETNKKGSFTSGTLRFNFEGEVCRYVLSGGTYTISGGSGTGTADLNWSSLSGDDADDVAFCNAELGSSFSEHFLFVLESSGKQLDLVTSDPGLTVASFSDDFPKFGSCIKQ